MRDAARSSTWATVRAFFKNTVAPIGSSRTTVARVAVVLRDLEASFLCTAQSDAWLERERSAWLRRVREYSRVDTIVVAGDDDVIGALAGLLNELGNSLIERSFRAGFSARTPTSVSARTQWRARSEMLVAGVSTTVARDAIARFRGLNVGQMTYESNESTDMISWRQHARRFPSYPSGVVIEDEDEDEDDDDDDDDNDHLDDDDPLSPPEVTRREELETLRDEVSRLRIEREQEMMCTICYSKKRDTLVCPCLHLMYCHECIARIARGNEEARCPHCRCVMSGTIRCFS